MRKKNQTWKKAAALMLAGCLAFSSVTVSANETGTKPLVSVTDLTTEYLEEPLGIEAGKVHFGWQMESDRIGAKQSAYQIVVYTQGNKDQIVWDSKKMESDRSTGILYEGKEPLKEGTAYEFTVTVWDEEGKEFQSKPSTFETGVTNQESFKKAEFIRMNKSAVAPIFRTEQKMNGKVAKARLYITAIGAYQAYVNGSQVSKTEDGEKVYHHMNPGYGNRNVSLGYETYDVTESLKGEAKAVVSVLAGTGWSDGQGGSVMGVTSAQPAVKAMLLITYEDGKQQTIATNTTDWKGTLQGPVTVNGVYYGEDYDARRAEELGDFTVAGYDDSSWVNADSGDGDAQEAFPVISNTFAAQKARYVRISVTETGPATKNDNENRLQIMELELRDKDGKNIIAGIEPKVSNNFVYGDQWSLANLTDGDYGRDSGKGYTSEMLDSGKASVLLDKPITIDFDLGEAVSFQSLSLYPRLQLEPVTGNECVNYPKTYTVQVSENGTDWKDVQTFTNSYVRNTVLYPEREAVSVGAEFDKTVNTDMVRVSVETTGPAVLDDNENRLQIMELELLDNSGNNVAAGVTPVVSDKAVSVAQWNPGNLTDGDYGTETDAGYSTDILDYGQEFLALNQPVTFDFKLESKADISSIKMYTRTKKESVYAGVCPSYPKVYTVQTSEDGGKTWKNILDKEDSGIVKNTILAGREQMSVTTYPGEIRAQAGTSGKIVDEYEQKPVSAVLYTGKASQSSYAGGEINVDRYYGYEKPKDSLYAGKYQEIAEGEGIFDGGITVKKGQTMIINMGQNLTAVPEVVFAASRGAKATMNFAEMLNDGSSVGNGATQADGPKGSLYQKSLRGARSAVKYTFAGDQKETYQTAMSFFGYQYIGITATEDVTVYAVRSRALSSVSEQTGDIETNNENVNKLFSNTLYGQLSNYYTTSTDCPQRDERLAWTGDTQAFAQTAVYNFNSVPFLNDLQEIFVENAKIKGYVPAVADDLNGFFSNWAAGWSDVLVIDPWTMYLQTGDLSILTDNWEALNSYMNYLGNHERGKDQAPIPNNQRNFGDWLSFQGTSVEVIFDYYYGYVTKLMDQMAGILGDTAKQSQYNAKFEAIKKKFLQTHVTFNNGNLVIKSGEGNIDYQFMHWAGKGGVWENNSQTALLWMLKLGFYENDEMKEAAEKLLIANIKNENPDSSSIRKNYAKNTLAVGFLGSNIITPLLSDIGYADVSYDLLLQDEQPSWLFEVKAGATTIWERWNSYTPGVGFGDSEMNSFNHYAYGSVVEWMYRYMAGITADPENPGFKNVILQPTMDKGEKYNDEERIREVDSSYESYYGTIESSWRSDDKGNLMSYETEIPANTTATLYLPVEKDAIEGFKTITGVSEPEMTEHNGELTAKISLESGGYEFAVNKGKLEVNLAEGYFDGKEEPTTPVEDIFDDVDSTSWFRDSVQYVFEREIMTGLTKTHFGSADNLSRAQFATILYRMEGEPEVDFKDNVFPDVSENQFYTNAAVWANKNKIITGYADKTFGPGDNITREQIATMMYRYAEYKKYDTNEKEDLSKFPDQGKVSPFAQKAMEWAVGAGMISGQEFNPGEKVLDPQGNTSRAACSAIIQRFMK